MPADRPLYSLTLWRPWDWAITRAPEGGPVSPKQIENRPWRPPGWLIGQRLAIHGGRKWDARGAAIIRELGFDVPRPEDWPGAISGIVTVAGYVTTSDDPWWIRRRRRSHPIETAEHATRRRRRHPPGVAIRSIEAAA